MLGRPEPGERPTRDCRGWPPVDSPSATHRPADILKLQRAAGAQDDDEGGAPESRIDAVDAPGLRAGAILGKHDKAAAGPQDRPELLHTGPIAIRGVGRATRDFFRPDRVNRHRLSAEEHAAAARAAQEDATATEQLDAAEVASVADRASEQPASGERTNEASGRSAFGALLTAADQDERTPTAQIPLTWMFSSASVDTRTPQEATGRASDEQRVRLMLEFPAALDAAAVEELQRRVLEKARGSGAEALTSGAGRVAAPDFEPIASAEHGADAEHEERREGARDSAAGASSLSESSEGSSGESPEGEDEGAGLAAPLEDDEELRGADTHRGNEEAPLVVEHAPGQEEPAAASGREESEQQRVAHEAGSASPMVTEDGEHLGEVVQAANDTHAEDQQFGSGSEYTPEPESGSDDQDASSGAPPDPAPHALQDQADRVAVLVQETSEEPVPLALGNEPGSGTSKDADATKPRADSALLAQDAADDRPSREPEAAEVTTDEQTIVESELASDAAARVQRVEAPIPTNSEDAADAPDDPGACGELSPGDEPDEGSSRIGGEQESEDSPSESAVSTLEGELEPAREDASGSSAPESIGAPESAVPLPALGAGLEETKTAPESGNLVEHDTASTEVAEPSESALSVPEAPDEPVVTEQLSDSRDGFGDDGEAGAAAGLRSQSREWLVQRDRRIEAQSVAEDSSPARGDSTDGSSHDTHTEQPNVSGAGESADGSGPIEHRRSDVEAPPTPQGSPEGERTETVPLLESGEPSATSMTGAADPGQGGSLRIRAGEGGEDGTAVEQQASALSPIVEPAIATALAAGLRPAAEVNEQSDRPSRRRQVEADRSPSPKTMKSRDRPPRGPGGPRPFRVGSGGRGGHARGYVGLAALALVTLALIAAVIVKTRDDAALAAKEAAAYTAPPLAPPSASSSLPVVSVVGDELSTGSSSDSGPEAEWPALLASALHADVKTFAAAGAGYVKQGAGGATLGSEAALVDPASTVVVLFGGGNDVSSSSLSLVTAATKAISTVQQRAPNAKIVVVGPTSAETTPSSALLAVRDTLQTVAKIGKAEWQDPIAGNWLSSSGSLTTSGGTPNDEGEKALESKLYSALRGLMKL